jgi:hypothetical protein
VVLSRAAGAGELFRSGPAGAVGRPVAAVGGAASGGLGKPGATGGTAPGATALGGAGAANSGAAPAAGTPGGTGAAGWPGGPSGGISILSGIGPPGAPSEIPGGTGDSVFRFSMTYTPHAVAPRKARNSRLFSELMIVLPDGSCRALAN